MPSSDFIVTQLSKSSPLKQPRTWLGTKHKILFRTDFLNGCNLCHLKKDKRRLSQVKGGQMVDIVCD